MMSKRLIDNVNLNRQNSKHTNLILWGLLSDVTCSAPAHSQSCCMPCTRLEVNEKLGKLEIILSSYFENIKGKVNNNCLQS